MKLGSIRFLVVDDMEVMRKLTLERLYSLGAVHIELAANGQAALKLLREKPFDLVLADWNMPVMSGIELLKAIRADKQLSALPVIMITAESQRVHILEAIACGVSELLLKPYTTQLLSDRVVKVLQRRQSGAEVQLASTVALAPIKAQSTVPDQLLPVLTSDAAPIDGAPTAAVSNNRLTVLLVDDTPDNLMLMTDLLKDSYRIKAANNGEKALAICTSATPPDLLLLDVMMPGMDGFELARQLRAHPNCELLPIIFVTAMGHVQSQRCGLSLGAIDFISKPFDPDILRLRVANFARLIQRQKERQGEYDEMLAHARLREDVDRMLRHDLRGPLAGVVGLAQQLAAAPELPARHIELVNLIERASLQALDSIMLSAELFKIETGRFRRRTTSVAVAPLLQQVAALTQASFGSKEVQVLCDLGAATDASTVGDPLLYSAAFHNLLKNACEAAPAQSIVQLKLLPTQPLIVTVENRGAVPLAVRAQLFTKYVSSKMGGSGLGMYSAKLLLEAQGGGIALHTSAEHDLTRVSVTLPTASI
jgi:hypothetical protein